MKTSFDIETSDCFNFSTDDEPPTFLNRSMDIDVEIMDPGVNTTVVNWTIPVASDNSKSVVVTPLTEEPGVFSVGTTLIVYSASDPSGNTANCSFNVIVRRKLSLIHRSIKLCPWRMCEQEHVRLSNAILPNCAARAKHTCTHVGPYSVGL